MIILKQKRKFSDENNNNDLNPKAKRSRIEYTFASKIEICEYAKTSGNNNSWVILNHFENKYPLLREKTIKKWIKLGKNNFQKHIVTTKNKNVKRKRKQKSYFESLERMLIESIKIREKQGFIRDIE